VEVAGPGDLLQEKDGDERLAGARSEREERPFLAARELFEDGTDRCVLVVAANGFAAGVADEKRLRGVAI